MLSCPHGPASKSSLRQQPKTLSRSPIFWTRTTLPRKQGCSIGSILGTLCIPRFNRGWCHLCARRLNLLDESAAHDAPAPSRCHAVCFLPSLRCGPVECDPAGGGTSQRRHVLTLDKTTHSEASCQRSRRDVFARCYHTLQNDVISKLGWKIERVP